MATTALRRGRKEGKTRGTRRANKSKQKNLQYPNQHSTLLLVACSTACPFHDKGASERRTEIPMICRCPCFGHAFHEILMNTLASLMLLKHLIGCTVVFVVCLSITMQTALKSARAQRVYVLGRTRPFHTIRRAKPFLMIRNTTREARVDPKSNIRLLKTHNQPIISYVSLFVL